MSEICCTRFSPLPGDAFATIEKVSYTRESKRLSLTLGDAYASFARGMALDLSRNTEIDIDSSIQGVKAVFRPGAWDVTALAQLHQEVARGEELGVVVCHHYDTRCGLGRLVESFGRRVPDLNPAAQLPVDSADRERGLVRR